MIVQPIGKFKLTYANGISQVKLLITQEDYKSIVKPISELGEFFTSTSPLGLALWSSRFPNLILPPQQGGGHFVRFEKLDLYENKEG